MSQGLDVLPHGWVLLRSDVLLDLLVYFARLFRIVSLAFFDIIELVLEMLLHHVRVGVRRLALVVEGQVVNYAHLVSLSSLPFSVCLALPA